MSTWSRVRAAWTESEVGIVVAPLSDALPTPLVLQGSAAGIWLALPDAGADAGIAEAALASRLAADFGIPEEQVRHDLGGFLRQMADSGLVRAQSVDGGAS